MSKFTATCTLTLSSYTLGLLAINIWAQARQLLSKSCHTDGELHATAGGNRRPFQFASGPTQPTPGSHWRPSSAAGRVNIWTGHTGAWVGRGGSYYPRDAAVSVYGRQGGCCVREIVPTKAAQCQVHAESSHSKTQLVINSMHRNVITQTTTPITVRPPLRGSIWRASCWLKRDRWWRRDDYLIMDNHWYTVMCDL